MKFSNFLKNVKSYPSQLNLNDLLGEVNINLGCGNRPLNGFINSDFYNKKYADVVFDLEKEFPFDDESVDLIFSDNVFEHIHNLLKVVDNCYRALKVGGSLVIKVPYFKSKHAFVDPTHVRFFTIQSFDYFIKNKYFNNQYKFYDWAFDELSIFLDDGDSGFLKNLISIYGINRPNIFENSIFSNIFVFHNITFVLKK